MAEEQKVKIYVDHRELKTSMSRALFELGAEIETKQLQVGDYILSDDVVVELKTCPDFVASLLDGRLFEQARSMKAQFAKPMYIIEGDIYELFEVRNVHPNALRAALLSLILDYKFPVMFSRDKQETAEILHLIAKREQLDNNKEISLRGSKVAYTLPEQQQYLIEGLPLVGPKLAKGLLKEFGSPLNILNASLEDLQKVDKMGKKKAEAVKRILEEPYKD